jgi:5'-deoxynucleotidase YfbR-like HD superfamily hydrolase
MENGKLHRPSMSGPSITFKIPYSTYYTNSYYNNGKLHRSILEGCAYLKYENGKIIKEYWENGKKIKNPFQYKKILKAIIKIQRLWRNYLKINKCFA